MSGGGNCSSSLKTTRTCTPGILEIQLKPPKSKESNVEGRSGGGNCSSSLEAARTCIPGILEIHLKPSRSYENHLNSFKYQVSRHPSLQTCRTERSAAEAAACESAALCNLIAQPCRHGGHCGLKPTVPCTDPCTPSCPRLCFNKQK